VAYREIAMWEVLEVLGRLGRIATECHTKVLDQSKY
jgi:hypothetical protein